MSSKLVGLTEVSPSFFPFRSEIMTIESQPIFAGITASHVRRAAVMLDRGEWPPGLGPARHWQAVVKGHRYDSKPLMAFAYKALHGRALQFDEFYGGWGKSKTPSRTDSRANRYLAHLGFRIVKR